MVEHHLEEEHAQRGRARIRHGGQDVGHLDPRPGPAELMVDVLLVVEQLAVRLRAQGHGAASLGDRTGPVSRSYSIIYAGGARKTTHPTDVAAGNHQ